jgi:hypothetical protein
MLCRWWKYLRMTVAGYRVGYNNFVCSMAQCFSVSWSNEKGRVLFALYIYVLAVTKRAAHYSLYAQIWLLQRDLDCYVHRWNTAIKYKCNGVSEHCLEAVCTFLYSEELGAWPLEQPENEVHIPWDYPTIHLNVIPPSVARSTICLFSSDFHTVRMYTFLFREFYVPWPMSRFLKITAVGIDYIVFLAELNFGHEGILCTIILPLNVYLKYYRIVDLKENNFTSVM